MTDIPWSSGTWTHPPAESVNQGEDLLVTAAEGSDAWRTTSYGFIHESEHALLAPFPRDCAVEVEFTAALSQQFDQAGVFVSVSPEHWVKAAVEYADGSPQLGAVVTDRFSDWSLAPVRDWAARRVRIRVSRGENALTIRAGVDDQELQLVRVVPFASDLVAHAGPLICAPARSGLVIPFHAWRTTPPDGALH